MDDMLFYIEHESDDTATDIFEDAIKWCNALGDDKAIRFRSAVENMVLDETITLGGHVLTLIDRDEDGAAILTPTVH
jgi:hypothetical protein